MIIIKSHSNDQHASEKELFRLAMNKFKEDIADDLGLLGKVKRVGWGGLTARECGRIGGKMGGKLGVNMIRKILAAAEAARIQPQEEGTIQYQEQHMVQLPEQDTTQNREKDVKKFTSSRNA